MNRISTVTALALAVSTGLLAPQTARADGAASTRNIIIGGAAAAAGTLLIINHNKKVHEKYAEYDREQAATASQRDQAEQAYASERQAYEHEASLVSDYKHENAYQHRQVVERDREIASLKRSLVAAKFGARPVAAAPAVAVPAERAAAAPRAAAAAPRAAAPTLVSYGWGTF